MRKRFLILALLSFTFLGSISPPPPQPFCIDELIGDPKTLMVSNANLAFYLSILGHHSSRDAYGERAKMVGIDKYADLIALDRFFNFFTRIHGKTILEVGVGRGRVIEGITKISNPKKVYGIDINPLFVNHCLKSFEGSDPVVDIRKLSVLNLDKDPAFKPHSIDIALWMWSGIIELNEWDKVNALKQLKRVLKPGGFAVIDVPNKEIAGFQNDVPHELAPDLMGYKRYREVIDAEKQMYSPYLYGHFILPYELFHMATLAGFTDIMILPYKTDTNKPRHMFILHGPENSNQSDYVPSQVPLIRHQPYYNTDRIRSVEMSEKIERILVVSNLGSTLDAHLTTLTNQHGWQKTSVTSLEAAEASLAAYGKNDRVLIVIQTNLKEGKVNAETFLANRLDSQYFLPGKNKENWHVMVVSNLADFKSDIFFGPREDESWSQKLLAYYPQPLDLSVLDENIFRVMKKRSLFKP